ncbi:MAG: tetratricopeptide repeat protein [Thermoanaerobaculia bacterium]
MLFNWSVRAPSALVAALLLLSGCSGCGSDLGEDLGTRAVVIGIDGADWKLIDRLIAEGEMPNLAAFRERAAWGEIETLTDIPLSPVIWTSVATGKTAAKHGISWFMVDRPDGTRVPVRSVNRKTKAIWTIAAENGRRPTVVGWWASYPAEDVGKGAIVSDGLGFHGFGSTARGGDDRGKVHPASLFGGVSVLVPPEQQVGADFVGRFVHITPEEYRQEMFDPGRFPERNPFNPIHLFQQYAVTAEGYTAIAEKLLAERPYDLFMLYFEQVDSFSHLFMKYMEPKLEWVDEQGFARYRDVVLKWYGYQDELLGRVLAGIDLDTTAVFILSDHGFKSGERRIRSEKTVDVQRAHLDHEDRGIFLAAGPHIRPGVEVAGAAVMDITPTVLRYLGLPVAKDMDGKVIETIFEEEFRRRHRIRYVETYEDPGGRVAEAGVEADPTASKENLRALEALGYLGGSSSDAVGGEVDAAEEDGEPSSPEIHNNLGRIHLRNGDLDKARSEFRTALELDPRNADALLNLASIQRAEGRTADAERLVERALAVDPSSIGALSQLAEIRRDLGDLDEALRLFEEALSIDNSLPFLHLGYGDVLQRAGRLDDAAAAFRMVLQLDPDSFKARYNLGVTLANQGDVESAIAMYEDALEVGPHDPEAVLAWNNLGAIWLDRGDTGRAMTLFEKAVAASGAHLESRYNLALILLADGAVDGAIGHLEAAASLAPNHEQVNLRLGLAYLEAGRGEDAFRSFLLVRRLYPANWAAPMGLAILHAANDRPQEARKLLAASIRLGGATAREAARGYPVLQAYLD